LFDGENFLTGNLIRKKGGGWIRIFLGQGEKFQKFSLPTNGLVLGAKEGEGGVILFFNLSVLKKSGDMCEVFTQLIWSVTTNF
jgi:hypothetical protein